jgi:predicted neutral ceramidase superfamily lipid hydrolase
MNIANNELSQLTDEIDRLKIELKSSIDATTFLIDAHNARIEAVELKPVYEQDLWQTFIVVTLVTLFASLGSLYASLKFNTDLQDSMYTTIVTNWFTNIIFSMTIIRKKVPRRFKSKDINKSTR